MPKKTVFVLLAVLLAAAAFAGCGPAGSTPAASQPVNGSETLNVFNWGEYIDPDVLQKFQDETKIKVNYNTFDSNEAMYAIVSTEGSTVDVIFPSDYMIERMIRENLLSEIDYSNVPNFKNVSEFCKNRSFDMENKYSVPYTWGTLGILYNKKLVTEPVNSWSILWDEKYKDNIYMYDSMRDSIGVALKKLGYSINTKNAGEIQKAGEALVAQKSLVKAYGTDDIKTSIVTGSGALGVVYSGDAVVSLQEDTEGILGYCIPKEGSNIFFDNVAILKNSKNKALAEKFINFLLDPENALPNTETIGYSSPIGAVMDGIEDSYKNNAAFNPPQDAIDRCEVYMDITGDETQKKMYEEIWNKVKAG